MTWAAQQQRGYSSDGLERMARIAFHTQRSKFVDPDLEYVGPKRPLGEVLEEGGVYMQAGGSSTYVSPPGIPRTTLGDVFPRLVLADMKLAALSRGEGRTLLTYVPPQSQEVRYLFADESVVTALLDRDFELPQGATPLLLRDILEDKRLDLTQRGYEFLMQNYTPTFTDDPLLGELSVFDGTQLTIRGGRGIRTSSGDMPRSTILALNSGLEDGSPGTIDNTLSDRIVTGRFELVKGQYPSEQLREQFRHDRS